MPNQPRRHGLMDLPILKSSKGSDRELKETAKEKNQKWSALLPSFARFQQDICADVRVLRPTILALGCEKREGWRRESKNCD
jgi:hypothetical protein